MILTENKLARKPSDVGGNDKTLHQILLNFLNYFRISFANNFGVCDFVI